MDIAKRDYCHSCSNTLERIYIGRRFKDDTERLERLFQMHTEMTARENANE